MRALLLLGLTLSRTAALAADPPLAPPARGFQVQMNDFTVLPGQDLEVCEYRRLPNTKAMDASAFQLQMPVGAHHFVIWRYGGDLQDDARFPQGPVESVGCAGVSPDEPIPQVLIPIQEPNATFRFPKGVALHLEANQQVWLNPHMKNLGEAPVAADIRFNFRKARKGTVKYRAQGLIAGNTGDIDIPAAGEQSLTAEWTVPVDMKFIYITTHQHQLGTYANIERVNPDGTRTMLVESLDWLHPKSSTRPLRLKKGEKLRITCQWRNPGPRAVRFGPETTDEMCFILGFYYRKNERDLIDSPECFPAKSGLLCVGAPAVEH